MFGAEESDVSELTNELIRAKLEVFSAATSAAFIEEALADVSKNFRLETSGPDASLRIVTLSAFYLQLCEKRRWKFVEKALKAAMKHIILMLQPLCLMRQVENVSELEQSELKDRNFEFTEILFEKALIFQEVYPLRQYRAKILV